VIGVALLVVAALTLVALAVRNPIALRLQTGSSYDRELEWSSALHQWWTSPFTGVGPDVILNLHTSPASFDHFAHNEYLQMLADGGIVGLALLGLSGVAVARATHRRDVASSYAAAGLVAFALAAGLDFDWHLPALALLGGWAAGMAGPGALQATGPPDAFVPVDGRLGVGGAVHEGAVTAERLILSVNVYSFGSDPAGPVEHPSAVEHLTAHTPGPLTARTISSVTAAGSSSGSMCPRPLSRTRRAPGIVDTI
jgi:hypothetical protein